MLDFSILGPVFRNLKLVLGPRLEDVYEITLEPFWWNAMEIVAYDKEGKRLVCLHINTREWL